MPKVCWTKEKGTGYFLFGELAHAEDCKRLG